MQENGMEIGLLLKDTEHQCLVVVVGGAARAGPWLRSVAIAIAMVEEAAEAVMVVNFYPVAFRGMGLFEFQFCRHFA